MKAANAALAERWDTDALLAKLSGEDRTYFEARRLASTGSVEDLYAQIWSGLSSAELKHDIEGRWLKRFADDGLTITGSLEPLCEDAYGIFAGAFIQAPRGSTTFCSLSDQAMPSRSTKTAQAG